MKCLKRLIFLLTTSLLLSAAGVAQTALADKDALFTTPKGYIAPFTATAIRIDGNIAEPAWQQAPWTEAFVDIEGSARPQPLYTTQVKMLWNDSCLFIAARLQEPHVWATLTQRDAIVYHDNDFEVFIDPHNNTHLYYEIEVNALNTVLDLLMPKPYRNGAAALLGYDVAHLQTSIQVQGTLNYPADVDTGWTVEMAIPFRALFSGNRWRPPAEGALWRINFSRVQWHTNVAAGKYVKTKNSDGKTLPEENWVWSPQGVVNMHYPERWGYLQFTKKEIIPFQLPYNEKRRPQLWRVYYRQQAYRAQHGVYASTLQQLGFSKAGVTIEGKKNTLTMEATGRRYMVYLTDAETVLSLNEEGLVKTLKAPL